MSNIVFTSIARPVRIGFTTPLIIKLDSYLFRYMPNFTSIGSKVGLSMSTIPKTTIDNQLPKTSESHIFKSPYRTLDIPENVLLTHHVTAKFREFADSVALADGETDQNITYSQLQTYIWKCASALTRLGIKKGDVVTILSPNCSEYVIAYLSISAIGAVVSTLNPLYVANELNHALSHSKSCLLITVPALVSVAKQATSLGNSKIKGIVVFGKADGCRPFSSLLEDDGKAYPENVDVNPKKDTAALLYSSGTTGLPKGVELTHYNIVANIEQLRTKDVMNYKPGYDTLVGVLPLFHVYGQVVVNLTSIANGSKIVSLPRFEPELFLNTMKTHRTTFLHVVPPIILFLAKHPLVEKYDFSTVHTVFTGAAPISAKVVEEAAQRIKVPRFIQGYGLTEASPVTHANPLQGYKYSTIGYAIHNTDFKFVNVTTGANLPPNEEGELCVRGPQVMKGYYNNPEATANTIKDGWLHTGDIGYCDDDCHAVITDRLKELIKYKGFQVAPAELEALLVTHASISDAAVIGLPDGAAGELPRAYVVLKGGANLTADEIHSFVKENLASYKQLRGGIVFRDSIPKAASGKILRRVLKDELKEENKKAE